MEDVIYADLKGVNFRPQEARDVVAGLGDGQELSLEREPGNQYDPNAIKVIDDETSQFIGYIEKDIAKDLAPLMDAGAEYECRVYSRSGTLAVNLVLEKVDDGEEEEDDEAEAEAGATADGLGEVTSDPEPSAA